MSQGSEALRKAGAAAASPVVTDNTTTTLRYTLEEAVEKIGFGYYQWKMLILTSIIWMADAMEMMTLSFLGPCLRCEWDLSSNEESLITTAVFLGMMIGTSFWGVLADKYGRKLSIMVCSIFLLAFGLASAFAPNYIAMVILRAIVGFGIGGVPVSFSMFMEIVPSARRGFWAVVVESSWTFGTVLQSLLGWAILPTLDWHWLLGVSVSPILIFVVAYIFVEESPRYLLSVGKVSAAQSVLRRIAKANRQHHLEELILVENAPGEQSSIAAYVGDEGETTYGASDAIVFDSTDQRKFDSNESESNSMDMETMHMKEEEDKKQLLKFDGTDNSNDKGTLALESTTPMKSDLHRTSNEDRYSRSALVRLKHYFRTSQFAETIDYILIHPIMPHLRRTTLLLWCLWVVDSFAYYGLVLLTTELHVENSGGCTGNKPNLTASDYTDIISTSFAEFPGLVLAALAVDIKFFGRRRTQIILLIISAACFFLLMAVSDSAGAAQTTFLFIGRAAILGAFQIAYLYTPEVYPTSVRSTAFGLANGWARVGGMIAPFIGQGLVQSGHIDAATITFGASAAIGVIGAYFLNVETSGRPLDEAVSFPTEKKSSASPKSCTDAV